MVGAEENMKNGGGGGQSSDSNSNANINVVYDEFVYEGKEHVRTKLYNEKIIQIKVT